MADLSIKCPTCKRKIHYQNKEGFVITKNSIIESNPNTGETHAICKFCKEKMLIEDLRLVSPIAVNQ
jgi:hypothetical protein